LTRFSFSLSSFCFSHPRWMCFPGKTRKKRSFKNWYVEHKRIDYGHEGERISTKLGRDLLVNESKAFFFRIYRCSHLWSQGLIQLHKNHLNSRLKCLGKF
jgi:hypothetical protein